MGREAGEKKRRGRGREADKLSFSVPFRSVSQLEPACAAALVPVYHKRPELLNITTDLKNVVVVVCGGNIINLELLTAWKKEFNV